MGIEVGELYATLSVETSKFNSQIDAAREKLIRLKDEEDLIKKSEKEIRAELEKNIKKYGENSKQVERLKYDLNENRKEQLQLKSELKQVNKELNNQTKAFANTAKQATNATDQIKSGFTLIKGLIVGYAGKTLYDALIGTNADYERSMTSFDVLLGSAEKAETLMKQIQDFSAKTPLKNEDVQQATQLLLSYGVSADEVMDKLRQLGDISQGNAEKLQRVSLAYGQMLAKGKVTGEELRQMTEAGVPLVEELSKVLNISTSELTGMIEKGRVGIPELNKALENMTSQGGKFYDMLNKQSQIMPGMLSTLSDNAEIFARKVGEKSFNYLENELRSLMATINEMSESGALDGLAADIGEDVANAITYLVEFVKWIYEIKDVLLVAAGAVIGYKLALQSLVIVQSVITWCQGLNAALQAMIATKKLGITYSTLYRAAMLQDATAINACSVAGLKDITVKGGQVVATNTATGATLSFNAALMANPIGLVIAAIGLLIGALTTYKLIAGQAKSETDKLYQSYTDATKSIDDNTSAQIAQAEKARVLKDRLYELDDQVRGGTLSDLEAKAAKEEMNNIVNTLNNTIPELSLAIDSETGAWNMQRNEIDLLTESFYRLTKAKAMATAYQAKIDEAAKTIVEADKIIKDNPAKERKASIGEILVGRTGSVLELPEIAQTAQAAKQQAEHDLIEWQTQLGNELSEIESLGGNKPPDKSKSVNSYSESGGGGAARSSSGGGSSTRNAEREAQEAAREAEQQRQDQVKAFVDGVAENERVAKRTADRALNRGLITEEQYLATIADTANRYRSYAEEVLQLAYMTEEEKQKYHKEYIEKAEDADDEYLAYFKKTNKEQYEEKKANSLEWIKQQEKEHNYDEAIDGYDRMKITLREYYEAGVIGAKDYEKALKDLNDQQLETRKSQYYWDSEDAKDYISKSDYYGTWGDDNRGEAIKRQLADLEAAREILGEVEYGKELDYWLQQLYEYEKENIDKLFDEESKRLKERYQLEIDNAKEIGDKRIAEAERVAEAETERIKKRTEKELAALDELEKARQEEKEDKDDNLELERLQNKLAYEMDEDNRKALEREIEKKQEEIADKEFERTIEAQRDAIKEREQLDLDRINRTLEYEKASAQQMVDHFTKLYTDKMSDANIAYEIYRKVDFTQYEKLGESLGAAAGEGFSKVFSGVINTFMEQMKTMGWGANAVTVRGGGGTTNTTNNNVNLTVTSPKISPSAAATALKKTLRGIELAGRL